MCYTVRITLHTELKEDFCFSSFLRMFLAYLSRTVDWLIDWLWLTPSPFPPVSLRLVESVKSSSACLLSFTSYEILTTRTHLDTNEGITNMDRWTVKQTCESNLCLCGICLQMGCLSDITPSYLSQNTGQRSRWPNFLQWGFPSHMTQMLTLNQRWAS